MKSYKSVREWKDFDRAEKVMFFVMLSAWLALSVGLYNQAMEAKNSQVIKSVSTERTR